MSAVGRYEKLCIKAIMAVNCLSASGVIKSTVFF
jgi:hypothetical protein